jgi:hypothetical protein
VPAVARDVAIPDASQPPEDAFGGSGDCIAGEYPVEPHNLHGIDRMHLLPAKHQRLQSVGGARSAEIVKVHGCRICRETLKISELEEATWSIPNAGVVTDLSTAQIRLIE